MSIASVSGRLVRLGTSRAYRRFLTSVADPRNAQDRLLRTQIRDTAACRYGEAHGLAADDGRDAFQRKVPMVRYDDLRPWVDRMIQEDEADVLSRHRVVRVEATSGTSSGVKWIPYTRPMMATFARMFSLWAHDALAHLYRPQTGRLFLCVTGGRQEAGEISPRLMGDDRDYLGQTWRHVLSQFVVAPRFAGTEDPLERLAEILIGEPNFEVFSFWSPSLLLSALDYLGIRKPEQVRSQWPRLQLISCWTAASSALFADRLRKLFPDVTIQGKGLLATEAAVTIPLEAAGGCVPLLDDVYLEFLPPCEDDAVAPLALHELEQGADYEVVLSNRGGFLRYRTGDCVQVTGRFHATPLLEFTGRTGIVSDLVGEKLTLSFVERELAAAIGRYFCLLPRSNGYELWVEQEESPFSGAASIDELLCGNYQYRRAYRLGQLAPVECFEAEGLAEKVRRALEGNEAHSGSRAFKPPLLVADQACADLISRALAQHRYPDRTA